MRRPKTLRESFEERTKRGDRCWEWIGSHNAGGYGRICVNRKWRLAHRVAYELFVGPIPEGLQLDHLCRNRGCVNPAHLEPVTGRVNTLRGETLPARNAEKTHCKRGHEFTPENTYLLRSGGRSCRTCQREAHRRYRPLKHRDLYCRHGHLRTVENTRITARGRCCRECDRIRDKRRREAA